MNKELKVGDILYSPEYNGFHSVRGINNDHIVLSNCCEYIDDSKTTALVSRVSYAYINQLTLIEGKKSDYPFIRWGNLVGAYTCTHNGKKDPRDFKYGKYCLDIWRSLEYLNAKK